MSVIEARSVEFSIGGVRILSNADLTVDRGEMMVLLGPNGAGKSTLLALMAGILSPTGGSIRLHSETVDALPLSELARRRSYLPPEPVPPIRFTTRDLIELGVEASREDLDQAGPVESAIEFMELTDVADLAIESLSTGEARRAQLARVLAQESQLMLLDEPTNGLDIAHEIRFLEELRDRTRSGASVLAVMHDLNLAGAMADQVALLNNGAIVARGNPDDVLTADTLTEVYRHQIDVRPNPTTGRPMITPRQTSLGRP